jgi:hypothetical protein
MSFVLILGVQIVFTGIFAKLYSYNIGILPLDEKFVRIIKKVTLEKLLITCLSLVTVGFGYLFYTLWNWHEALTPVPAHQITLKGLITSLTLITVSVQGLFNGFMLSLQFTKTGRNALADRV